MKLPTRISALRVRIAWRRWRQAFGPSPRVRAMRRYMTRPTEVRIRLRCRSLAPTPIFAAIVNCRRVRGLHR